MKAPLLGIIFEIAVPNFPQVFVICRLNIFTFIYLEPKQFRELLTHLQVIFLV